MKTTVYFKEEHLAAMQAILPGKEVKPAFVIDEELTDEEIAQVEELAETLAKEGNGGAVIPIRSFQNDAN